MRTYIVLLMAALVLCGSPLKQILLASILSYLSEDVIIILSMIYPIVLCPSFNILVNISNSLIAHSLGLCMCFHNYNMHTDVVDLRDPDGVCSYIP